MSFFRLTVTYEIDRIQYLLVVQKLARQVWTYSLSIGRILQIVWLQSLDLWVSLRLENMLSFWRSANLIQSLSQDEYSLELRDHRGHIILLHATFFFLAFFLVAEGIC